MPIIEIKKLENIYIDTITRLHISNLRTPFRGTVGIMLLQLYYRGVLFENGSVGYIGLVDGECHGFVCGVWDSKLLKHQILSNNLVRLIFWTGLLCIISPKYILNLFNRLLDKKNRYTNIHGYELRPIVVDPQTRGTGLAGLLVDRLVEDANSRGYRKMHLYVEDDNLIARKFYSKKGFSEIILLEDCSQSLYEKVW